jgi:ribose transport system permease protein
VSRPLVAAAPPRSLRRRLFGAHNIGLLGAFAAIVVAGAVLSPYFLTASNLLTILTSASVIGVISVGMTFIILAGGIDLSVGAIVALAGVCATTPGSQSLGWLVMVGICLAVSAAVGLLNGALIAYGRMVPFIATLAMLVAARGLAQHISGGVPQTVNDATFNNIGSALVLGIPAPVWVFAAVVVVGWIVLNRTTFGRRTIAIGGNAEASRLAGIDVARQTLVLYVLSGLCAGIASVLLTARLTSGSNDVGNLYELDAIAAVIIGGTRLSGGRGTLAGSIVGVLIFTLISNIFVLENLPSDIQSIAKGVIIVAAVLLQRRNSSSR